MLLAQPAAGGISRMGDTFLYRKYMSIYIHIYSHSVHFIDKYLINTYNKLLAIHLI